MAETNEVACVTPTVRIGSGASIKYATSTTLSPILIEDEFGIKPSRCMLRYQPGQDVEGPLTLLNGPVENGFPRENDVKHGQRVIVYNGDTSTIWFQGWTQKRQDQHAQNTVIWSAFDDRVLLKYIPVRGSLVRDIRFGDDGAGNPTSPAALRYAASLPTSFNPGGAWNCTGFSIGGRVYPVFTPTAYFGAAYESPDEAFPGVTPSASNPFGLPTDGKPVPWTPRRALEYLRLWIYFEEIYGSATIDGMVGDIENSLDSDILSWPEGTNEGLVGKDPGISATVDPLDKKMQPLQIQGDMALGSLVRTLDVAGTHGLDIKYDTTSFTPEVPPAGKSLIFFKPIGYTAEGEGLNLGVQYNGTTKIEDANGSIHDIFDFNLEEDSTGTVPLVANEGAVSKVELRMAYTGDRTTSELIPAWSEDEQSSFLRCIYGNATLSGDPGTYALVPKVNGKASLSASDYVTCDGQQGSTSDDTPRAFALTQEAIALARQSYPTVFRAWKVNPVGNLAAALEEPEGASGYLRASRPILPQQLQFFTWLSNELGDDDRLRQNLPIRVSIKFDFDTWYDIPKDVSVRVTAEEDGNNLIWLDGLAEAMDSDINCIYSGSLFVAADIRTGAGGNNIDLKEMRVNAAVPTDYRTRGKAGETLSWRDGAMQAAFKGAGQLHYLDTPNSFNELLQYKSFPGASPNYFGGTDGTDSEGDYDDGLTRELPPGSEAIHAQYAAQREFARRKNVKRTSTWKRAGIQKSPEAGDWIDYIYVYYNGVANNYELRSSIGTVAWDFLAQETRVGNVYGEIT